MKPNTIRVPRYRISVRPILYFIALLCVVALVIYCGIGLTEWMQAMSAKVKVRA